MEINKEELVATMAQLHASEIAHRERQIASWWDAICASQEGEIEYQHKVDRHADLVLDLAEARKRHSETMVALAQL